MVGDLSSETSYPCSAEPDWKKECDSKAKEIGCLVRENTDLNTCILVLTGLLEKARTENEHLKRR